MNFPVISNKPALKTSNYYGDKKEILKDLFGAQTVLLGENLVIIDDRSYPVIDDVIILLDPSEYPGAIAQRIQSASGDSGKASEEFAEDIQFTFGEEWKTFPEVLSEQKFEFRKYFDLIDLAGLRGQRVCDLGCGIGRWSYFLSRHCRELILVDFSESIFVARQNLALSNHALFFMGNIEHLPFRSNFADLIFCLGVLHHLPKCALEMVTRLRTFAPKLLIYLYYALDNRPFYFRLLLKAVTKIRLHVSNIRNAAFRTFFTWAATFGLYLPFLGLGSLLKLFGCEKYVPLYEGYNGKSLRHIRQDVYDRFFTRIEQRFSRKEILDLREHFARVTISDQMPYWHFLCVREIN